LRRSPQFSRDNRRHLDACLAVDGVSGRDTSALAVTPDAGVCLVCQHAVNCRLGPFTISTLLPSATLDVFSCGSAFQLPRDGSDAQRLAAFIAMHKPRKDRLYDLCLWLLDNQHCLAVYISNCVAIGRLSMCYHVPSAHLQLTPSSHSFTDFLALIFRNGRPNVLVQPPFGRIWILGQSVFDQDTSSFELLFDNQLFGKVTAQAVYFAHDQHVILATTGHLPGTIELRQLKGRSAGSPIILGQFCYDMPALALSIFPAHVELPGQVAPVVASIVATDPRV
jgi:hypothetical protein